MVCEQYRDGLMAMLDGELPEQDRSKIEQHLHQCPHCNSEYHQFEDLAVLTSHLKRNPGSAQIDWENYWSGVCGKLRRRGNLTYWAFASLALLLVGNLMLFGLPTNVMTVALGGAAFVFGVALLGLSFFCNCRQ